jgi:lipopolysaccharide biosynthesis regulator YciM
LIARPSLTEDQRLQAIYELAQDYYKAGLLDRAEDLFNELKESSSYRELALVGLTEIYQQEKDWAAAIEVIRQHKRPDRAKFIERVAHYWCELAELAITDGDFDAARKYLRNALSEKRTLARAVMLRGELHFQQGEYRRALSLWQSLSTTSPVLASLVVGKAIKAFDQVGDRDGLKQYLIELSALPRDAEALRDWLSALERCVGRSDALRHLFDRTKSEGLNGPVAEYLSEMVLNPENHDDSDQVFSLDKAMLDLNSDLLDRAKQRRIEYTCQRCGFDTRSHYWLCPNCGEWDSFSN